jgi:hypothetical protein
MTLKVIDRIAARLVGPDRDLGDGCARSLRTRPVSFKICDRDALQLGYLAELGWPPKARPRRAKHDHPTVVQHQFTMPDRSAILLMTQPLGETETPDQPVHRRTRVFIQQVWNHLGVWRAVRHEQATYRKPGKDHKIS